jgi:hypothetical protein
MLILETVFKRNTEYLCFVSLSNIPVQAFTKHHYSGESIL